MASQGRPETPKGPHLIQSTLRSPRHCRPLPFPSSPRPRQLPYNLSSNDHLTCSQQTSPSQDTHFTLALLATGHTQDWHLRRNQMWQCLLTALWFSVIVSRLTSDHWCRPSWLDWHHQRPELGPRPARTRPRPQRRPGSASFYLQFKCVQNWNNLSLITQPETSGPLHLRIHFLWCSILETGLLTISDLTALLWIWQLQAVAAK